MSSLAPSAVACLLSAALSNTPPSGEVSGRLEKWHDITVTFRGPRTSESSEPNPFRDYRLDVTFTREGRRVIVPGYWAADGNAAESGAEAGDRWRARFLPDASGTWSYRASFRKGKDVALADDRKAGESAGHFDGAEGSFEVAPLRRDANGPRARGLLRYAGDHHLRFAETGEPFLKGGADSPENFLAYSGFDGTRRASEEHRRPGEAAPGGLHEYAPHVRDWRPGDPTWRDGRGKGIIGALNYLASKGMNSVYFLTMNVGGDGRDVWPWTSDEERYRFDVSKLGQWEIVFSHMDRLGILLHVITQEQENDQLLDGGRLGPERRLYYRELIARFGHHLAITWNLGEENTNTDEQRKAFCEYFQRLDPYDHPIVVHTFPGKYEEVYNPLLGFESFEGPSLQTNDTHRQTLLWRERSARAGRPWFVCLDEIGPAHTGVKPDADDPSHDEVRTKHLWGNLMAGGAGVEWYFGYRYAHNDLDCEDWRSRDRLWDMTRNALLFFRDHLPFTEMAPADGLTTAEDDYCLALEGEVYAIYLPRGGTTELDLGDATADFRVRWHDPRRTPPPAGAAPAKLETGSVRVIEGPGKHSIGRAPRDTERDWAVLVEREDRRG